jgi:hypothetical protein
MRRRILFTLILALALGAFANITGSLTIKGTSTGVSSAQVGYNGTLYSLATDGSFNIPTTNPASIKHSANQTHKVLTKEYDVFGRKINLNQTQSWATQVSSFKQYTTVQAASARSLSSSTDTLYIVVNGDTLREVPITSWNEILPPNYIQQRNVQVNVNQAYSYDVVQAVWWNNDSIAHVLNLSANSLVSGSFSGYIYTVYNDSEFRANDTIYNLFVRTRSHDSITSYTKILPVYAQVGDLVFPATVFKQNTYHTTLGYSLTPNDSSIAVFSTRNIEMVYVVDTTDSVAVCDSSAFAQLIRTGADSAMHYKNGQTTFQANQFPNPLNVDTTINTWIFSDTLKGRAVSSIDTLKLYTVDAQGNTKMVATVYNLKAGDTFKVKVGYNPALVQFFDNSNVDNLEFSVDYRRVSKYWKNP